MAAPGLRSVRRAGPDGAHEHEPSVEMPMRAHPEVKLERLQLAGTGPHRSSPPAAPEGSTRAYLMGLRGCDPATTQLDNLSSW